MSILIASWGKRRREEARLILDILLKGLGKPYGRVICMIFSALGIVILGREVRALTIGCKNIWTVWLQIRVGMLYSLTVLRLP